MTFLAREKSKQTFQDRLAKKAPGTRELYQIAFKNFEKFCNDQYDRSMEEVISEFSVVEEHTVCGTLQDWIDWNVIHKKNPSTIRMWFSCINSFLKFKGIRIDIKENLDFPKKIEEELYPLQLDDIRKILSIAKYDKKCLYLCQISSGMRIAELMQLKKKDLRLKKRIVVKIPAENTKAKKGRTTFFSIEAQEMLLPKLKRIKDEDFVFGKRHNTPLKHKSANEQIILSRYLEQIGLDEKYANTHHKITTHSFRAYFITKISRHDPNFAKKLVGQKGYLLQYDRQTDEEKLQRYLELESDLLVFDESKKNAEIKELKNQKSNLEGMYADAITSMSDKILNLENQMKKLKSN